MVYASENSSLAALELFVHVSPSLLPVDLISIRGIFPDTVSTLEIEELNLPGNWRDYPAPNRLQAIGTDWLLGKASVVLVVPSAINSLERNLLLNPAHPEFAELGVESGRPFRFDPRLFGK